MEELTFKHDNIAITPSKTYLARVTDDGKTKCLGTYRDKNKAINITQQYKKERLERECAKYGHRVEDGVIVKEHYILFDNSDIFVIDTGRKLKPDLNGAGYLFVSLNGKSCRLHRLVAENFIPKVPGKNYVNHKDGVKTNNDISNLEWCTQSENVKHAFDMGLMTPNTLRGDECPWSKLTSKDVQEIRNTYIPKDKEYSQHALAKKYNVSQQLISRIILNERWKDNSVCNKTTSFLYDYQLDAVNRIRNGCILKGGVGSGKSRTSLFYYLKECGGWIDKEEYTPMTHPKDLYIISTAQKRNLGEWDEELIPFLLYPDQKTRLTSYGTKAVVDSWNNIKKYSDVTGAFFIFDEDRVTGSGSWVKSFLKIAKNNDWIILSATPGDNWSDYEAVFVANGFFKNKSELRREHFIYSRYTKYPKIDGYMNESRLIYLRDRILVDMDFDRKTVPHHEYVNCKYDTTKYKQVIRNRWDPFKDEPIQQASGLCYVLRRIVNTDESRQVAVLELIEKHPRAIIFYNHDHELDILRNLVYPEGTVVAEYNGHVHDRVPNTERWVYLVNYNAGNAGWNCITTNCIIFYSQNYSYKIVTQAAGRIDRLTSPYRDLYYYHLRSQSGIDLAITRALKNKKDFNEKKFAGWDK